MSWPRAVAGLGGHAHGHGGGAQGAFAGLGVAPQAVAGKEPESAVDINECAPIVRSKLTRRAFQDELEKRTNTVIVTRGLYTPPGMPLNGRKPMHLFITAAPSVPWEEKQSAIDAAVRIVSELMGPNDLPSNASADVSLPAAHAATVISLPVAPKASLPALVRGSDGAQAFTALDNAPPAFDAAGWLRGFECANLDYFSVACPGVSASVRGCGSGVADGEPLHIRVDWVGDGSDGTNKRAVLDDAVRNALQLVAAAREAYQLETGQLPSPLLPPMGDMPPPRAPPGIAPPSCAPTGG